MPSFAEEGEPVPGADVTRLLRQWRDGDAAALDDLLPLVYQELRRLAQCSMAGERSDNTLQPTALVAEAYLRLVDIDVDWNDRVHFYSVAANLMRRILVDAARRRGADKRGGGQRHHSLDELARRGFEPAQIAADADLMELDDALSRLEALDRRKSRVIELRFFGGLTIEETAMVMELSHATVERDLKMAKAWLAKELRVG